MSTSLRIDTTELISGALLIGETGLGVLGSAIPATGDNGAGYAYNDLSLPADNSKEICGRITTWPSAGTLFAYEDTSFDFTAPDGAYSFQYQLYVDGVATGSPTTVNLQVGVGPQQLTASQLNNTSLFYSPTLAPGAVTVAPSLYSNAQAFYILTLTTSKTLVPALFTNSNALYVPIVSLGTGPQIVAPSLFSNTQSYFTQTVVPGVVSLFPTMFTSVQAFYSPTVAAPGVMTLTQADINAIVAALSLAALPVNVVQINGQPVIGSGTVNDPWRNASTAKRPYITP